MPSHKVSQHLIAVQYKTNNEFTLLKPLKLNTYVSWVHIYVETYEIVHFKCVQFIVCPLYLDKAIKTHTQKKLPKLLNIAKAVRDISYLL